MVVVIFRVYCVMRACCAACFKIGVYRVLILFYFACLYLVVFGCILLLVSCLFVLVCCSVYLFSCGRMLFFCVVGMLLFGVLRLCVCTVRACYSVVFYLVFCLSYGAVKFVFSCRFRYAVFICCLLCFCVYVVSMLFLPCLILSCCV